MDLLSRKFVRKIRDSKKFILTNAISGNANSIDSMIRDSRGLRNDEGFNQHTTQQNGNLISPITKLGFRSKCCLYPYFYSIYRITAPPPSPSASK